MADSVGFRLCYKATAGLLLASAVVIGLKQFFGTPMHCIAHGQLPKTVNCWDTGDMFLRLPKSPSDRVAYPGCKSMLAC